MSKTLPAPHKKLSSHDVGAGFAPQSPVPRITPSKRLPPEEPASKGERAAGPTEAHQQTGRGSRHLSRSCFCLMLPTVRTTHQLAWYKAGRDAKRRRRRRKARQPASARLGEKMTLETANSLDESRAHLPEVQKSAKAARNGQSKALSPQKKKKKKIKKTRDFEEEGSPIYSHQNGNR